MGNPDGLVGSTFLLADGAEAWAQPGTWLVFGDATGWPAAWLGAGADLAAWRRRAFGGPAGELPEGLFDGAILACPSSREELAMDVELAAARLPVGAPVLLHGANREGIKSAGARLEPWFDQIETLDARRHARVWRGRRTAERARGRLEEHEVVRPEDPWGRPRPWVSWPGCFARGALDPGTALLLRGLPALEGEILDLGCGVGAVRAGAPPSSGRWTGSDVDALACRAAARNAPYDALVTTEGLAGLPATRWDGVVSNPPVHRGVDEDDAVLRTIVADLPPRMAPGGRLRVVVQRHRAFGRWLAQGWREVTLIEQDNQYQVWGARV